MTIAALMIIFAAVIGSTAMVGIFAYLFHRLSQIESGTTDAAGSRQLDERVNLMQEELLSLQTEMSALAERLDFTEKLLMSGEDSGTSDESE